MRKRITACIASALAAGKRNAPRARASFRARGVYPRQTEIEREREQVQNRNGRNGREERKGKARETRSNPRVCTHVNDSGVGLLRESAAAAVGDDEHEEERGDCEKQRESAGGERRRVAAAR